MASDNFTQHAEALNDLGSSAISYNVMGAISYGPGFDIFTLISKCILVLG